MILRLRLGTAAALLVASGIAQAQTKTSDFHQRFVQLASRPSLGDSARLAALFALDWEYTNVESPETATFVGYPGQDERWSDNSPAAIARRRRELADRLLVLAAIDRQRLNASDRLSFDIFKRSIEESIEGARFPRELLAVTQRDGPQYLASVLAKMPTSSVADYERILARLAALPAVLAQTRALLDSGLAVGVTPRRESRAASRNPRDRSYTPSSRAATCSPSGPPTSSVPRLWSNEPPSSVSEPTRDHGASRRT